MSENGVRSTDVEMTGALDEVLGNKDGSTKRQSLGSFTAQLMADGPIKEGFERIDGQMTTNLRQTQSWAQLQALTADFDGVGGEVIDADAGTHLQATSTGYNGASVPNAGRYSWNAGWALWVRIGDTGLSSKADAADVAAKEDARRAKRMVSGTRARAGIVPIVEAGDDELLMWFDQRLGQVRSAGDGFTGHAVQYGGWVAPMVDGAGQVLGGLHGDGQLYSTASRAAMGYPHPATDGATTRNQVHISDGEAVRRLSIFNTGVLAVERAGPGVFRAACADGSTRYASYRGVGNEGADGAIRAIIIMGQSTTVGGCNDSATVIINEPPSGGVLMWSQGVVPAGPGAGADLVAADFTALVSAEETYISPNFGDTGWTAMGWAVNGPAGRAGGSKTHIASFGKANTAYSGLKQGTGPYANALASLEGLQAYCDANNIPLRLDAIFWDHAENNSRDVGGDTSEDSEATYAAHMLELLTDFTSDASALGIEGATYCPMLVMQRGIFNNGELSGPSLAMANCNEISSRMHCAGPQYMWPYQDTFHCASKYYPLRASYFGKALRELILRRVDKPTPLRMRGAQVTGCSVEVEFDVRYPPLRIDENIVTNPGAFGLSFTDTGDDPDVIEGSVQITGPNKVRFELTSPGSGVMKVRTAWHDGTNTAQGSIDGPRSCICDSDMEADPSTGQMIPNYATHQEVVAT